MLDNIARDLGGLGSVGERGLILDSAVVADRTHTLKAYEQVIVGNTTTAAITVTLPRLAEAAGRFYSFFVLLGAGNDLEVLVPDADESYSKAAIEALNADATGDNFLLFCDGFSWHLVCSSIA